MIQLTWLGLVAALALLAATLVALGSLPAFDRTPTPAAAAGAVPAGGIIASRAR